MTKFKIEDNIPLPPLGGRGPRTDYPFLEMKPGQSIFVPDTTVKKMSGQISHWKKAHGLAFTIRAVTEDALDEDGDTIKVEGVRVWLKSPSDKPSRSGRKPASATKPEAEAEAETEAEADAEAEDEADAEAEDEADAEEPVAEEPVAEKPAPKTGKKAKKPAAEESEY